MQDIEVMTNDELKLEVAILLRDIVKNGIMDAKELQDTFHVSSATIAGWKSDVNERMVGVETAKKAIPLLRKILNKESLEGLDTNVKFKSCVKFTHKNKVAKVIAPPISPAPPIVNIITVEKYTKDQLKGIYRDKIGEITEKVNSRLNEYFGYLEYARPNDWQTWAYKGMEITSSKKNDFLNGEGIAYLLGVYKGWMRDNCWGGFSSNHFTQISKKIEERFSVKMTDEAIHKMHKLLASYGTINIMESIFESTIPDTSVIVMDNMLKYCIEKGFEKE